MHRRAEPLRADVDVHDDALRSVGQAGVAVGHGERDHLRSELLSEPGEEDITDESGGKGVGKRVPRWGR
jgi:hypothetical protein